MTVNLILRRVSTAIVTLLLVSIIVFLLTSILLDDIAQIMLGQSATPDTLAALRKELGLDQPLYLQYLSWLGDLFSGDLGISKAGGASITSLIEDRLGNTLTLLGLAALISVPISVALGLWVISQPGSWLDRIINSTALSIISLPEFIIVLALITVLAVELYWLPSTAYLSGNETYLQLLKVLTIPLVTLVCILSAQMIRIFRFGIATIADSSSIELAVLSASSRYKAVSRPELYQTVGTIIFVVATSLANLLSSMILVELFTHFPGIGRLILDSATTRDTPLLQACAMILATTYVALTLIADIALMLSNPQANTRNSPKRQDSVSMWSF